MLEIIRRHPNLRIIIRIIILLIYMMLASVPGGFLIHSILDSNPQDEFCGTTNEIYLKDQPQDKLGFVFIFPNFVPYDPVKHDRLATFYAPSSEGSFAGAHWIKDGVACRLQFDAIIPVFLFVFMILSIPAILIFRSITKNLF